MKQYAGKRLNTLINNAYKYLSTDAINDFYDVVYNVKTAKGFGLDVWGRIVAQNRYLKLNDEIEYFGFDEADFFPFDDGVFYDGVTSTTNYRLDDGTYRLLILMKAFANISQTTIPNLNFILSNLFEGRGRVYVVDNFDMTITINFEFPLSAFEVAVINSGVIPHPCGVGVNIQYLNRDGTFGFKGTGAQPFNQGTFYIRETIDANTTE